MTKRKERKLDHIRHALDIGQSGLNDFSDISFVHNSLPLIDLHEVDMKTKIGGIHLSSPIFINAMTGGGGEGTYRINRDLAMVARQCEIPIAVGSQKSALRDSNERASYEIVRKLNPRGIVFGNIGGECSVDDARHAVDMIEANALQIHLNPIQELAMPEGDRSFSAILRNIEQIVDRVDVPVIVKEVGFGMSRETARKLVSVGVSHIDVGGKGGTNFARIENSRSLEPKTFLDEWGISTTRSLLELSDVNREQHITVIASGGISKSIEVTKSIALGASAVGLAGAVLKYVHEGGTDLAVQYIDMLKTDVSFMMTALGAKNIDELQRVSLVILGETREWCNARNIDTNHYGTR